MATQKPISTVSYNTESFLVARLMELYDRHKIQAFMYICHKGEDGDKDHIHLRIEPNCRLDPMDLKSFFNEYIKGEEKPLSVRPWRSSKEEDWFLYAVHDPQYMAIKYPLDTHEKLVYSWDCIKVSPDYDLDIAKIRAKQSLLHSAPSLVSALISGQDPLDLVKKGENVFTVSSVQRLIESKRKQDTFDHMDKEFQRVSKENVQLLKLLDDLGYLISFDRDSVLTFSKKSDNL